MLNYRRGVMLVALIVLIPFMLNDVTVAQTEAWQFELLEATANSVTVELTVNRFETRPVIQAGVTYQQLYLDDRWGYWGDAGQPALPVYAATLGMPILGDPRIEIITAESQTYPYQLAPNPQQELGDTPSTVIERFIPDADAYAQSTAMPSDLAVAADIGLMRDQPLFQLRLQPFQYTPSQQSLRVYHRLVVRVTFPHESRQAGISGETTAEFEQIFQETLLNYEALPRPRLADKQVSRQGPITAQATSAVKLLIEQSGFYRLTYADLRAASRSLTEADPRQLELSLNGLPIPLGFTGEADGSFDSGDYFIFYGQAIDNLYTRHNVYWLRDKGSAGARLTEREVTPKAYTTPTRFPMSERYEQNNIHWQERPNSEGNDNWFWKELTDGTPSAELTFELANLPATGPAGRVNLSVHGAKFGDRQTQLTLNDQALYSSPVSWSNKTETVLSVAVPQEKFVNGLNRLRIDNTPPSGTKADQPDLYVDWLEILYQDSYVAENDELRFAAPTIDDFTFELTHFSQPNIALFDISDWSKPVRLTNMAVFTAGSQHTVRFSDSAGGNSVYLAQSSTRWLTPTLVLDEPSTWKSPSNGATYVIITHPEFFNTIEPLATYRREQGESVVVIKSDDLYDEFSHGIYGPQAIRSFLEYAYANWSPRPVYVLLVGDASQDPKNHRGNSLSDLLPTYYVNAPLYGESASDYWYAKVNGGDEYPDLIMGRIPARFGHHPGIVTDKVKAYEQSSPAGDWMKRAILVADDDSASFKADMALVASLLPPQMSPVLIDHHDANNTVSSQINQGALLLAYSGHGNEDVWGRWSSENSIFNGVEINNLSNGYKLPFVTVANCLNGRFTKFNCCSSMSERFLLREGHGAIAVWAPSSYGFPTPNKNIQRELYTDLLSNRGSTLGAAAFMARVKAPKVDPSISPIFYETFIFFGDPATRLNVLPSLDLTAQTVPNRATIGETVGYTLNYTVSYAAQANDLILRVTLPPQLTIQSSSAASYTINGPSLTINLGDTVVGAYAINLTAQLDKTLTHGQQLISQAVLQAAGGLTATTSMTTTAQDAPIMGLVATSDQPTEWGSATHFSATKTLGTNVAFEWDFGDGTPPQNGSTVSHAYAQVGRYTAVVSATNGVGIVTKTLTVRVGDGLLVDLSNSSPTLLGQPTAFEAQVSQATDLSYQWDFGDGRPAIITASPTISYTYPLSGPYTARLTVTNPFNGAGQATSKVDVLGQPSANFSSNSPQIVGQSIQFSNSTTFGGDEAANMIYQWDFGDGGSDIATQPNHRYSTVGLYTVTLKASNRLASDRISRTVRVTERPIEGLSVHSSSPTMVGNRTMFSVTTTAGTGVSYSWNFGDGAQAESPLTLTHHDYQAIGVYTVQVTATNDMGSVTASTVVTMTDSQPVAIFISSSPDLLGQTTSFQSLSQGSNLVHAWDFGDGRLSGPTSAPTITHQYAMTGSYTVVLTVSNGAGQQVTSGTVDIEADVRPPIARFESSSPDVVGTATRFINRSQDGGTTATYLWEFGDGSTSTTLHPTHQYSMTGSYGVSLTVTNSEGRDTTTQTVSIIDEAIGSLVQILHDGPTLLGSTTTLSAVVSSGSNVSYVWDLGDMTVGQGQTVQHQYPQVGPYMVVLTVTNSQGQRTVTETVMVEDIPIAGLRVQSNSPITLGQTVSLTASIEAGSQVTFSWEFGDDSHQNRQLVASEAMTHTYQAAGEYVVRVTAQNSRSTQFTQTTVVVLEVASKPEAKTYLPLLIKE